MRYLVPAAIGSVVLFAPAIAAAHFILHLPAATLEQNARGNPQKLFPCGGTSVDPGVPSGAVTEARGGDPLHIKIEETVFHPGHYRIALAVNDLSELPADPETVTRDSERGPISVSAAIDPDPQAPVLADGLFVHTEAPEPGSFWETDITLPNIDCDNCTLQVVQWMAEHGHNPDGDFSYHHCATLKIEANPDLPIDAAWPGQAQG
jgi:hypothetical protein